MLPVAEITAPVADNPAAITDARLQDALDYWRLKSAGKPSRAALTSIRSTFQSCCRM